MYAVCSVEVTSTLSSTQPWNSPSCDKKYRSPTYPLLFTSSHQLQLQLAFSSHLPTPSSRYLENQAKYRLNILTLHSLPRYSHVYHVASYQECLAFPLQGDPGSSGRRGYRQTSHQDSITHGKFFGVFGWCSCCCLGPTLRQQHFEEQLNFGNIRSNFALCRSLETPP